MSLTLVVIVLYNTHFDIFKDYVFWILLQVFLVLKIDDLEWPGYFPIHLMDYPENHFNDSSVDSRRKYGTYKKH